MISNGQKRKRFINEVNKNTLTYEEMNLNALTEIHKITKEEQKEIERKLNKINTRYFNPIKG